LTFVGWVVLFAGFEPVIPTQIGFRRRLSKPFYLIISTQILKAIIDKPRFYDIIDTMKI
jgi:hypothetical protein